MPDRQLQGGEIGAAYVSSGSAAGPPGQQSKGRCTSHTGPSTLADRYVYRSGQPTMPGERFLPASSCRWPRAASWHPTWPSVRYRQPRASDQEVGIRTQASAGTGDKQPVAATSQLAAKSFLARSVARQCRARCNCPARAPANAPRERLLQEANCRLHRLVTSARCPRLWRRPHQLSGRPGFARSLTSFRRAG